MQITEMFYSLGGMNKRIARLRVLTKNKIPEFNSPYMEDDEILIYLLDKEIERLEDEDRG